MESTFFERIERKRREEIQTFLDELANGTANYRSLHSLTQQLERQYHSRFAIELLQNAHDALQLNDGMQTLGRIEFRYVPQEPQWGTLYVANDGRAFTDEDFASLAALGRSQKDPNRCVGNKGIGFRSVLEISWCPEIYSSSGRGRGCFDGYCFHFDPAVGDQLLPALLSLQSGGSLPQAEGLVDWTESRLSQFRARWGGNCGARLQAELQYLSPYVLPLAVTQQNDTVEALAREGFATAVRLPLKNDRARGLVLDQLSGLEPRDFLFLDGLKSLTVDTGDTRRTITREATARGDKLDGKDVTLTLSPSDATSSRYWVWSKRLGGDGDPGTAGRLEESVRGLPGRWPQLREATLSVAVEVADTASEGRYSIFLPTNHRTGVGAYVNGPFYGDISRTAISFDEPLNDLLLTESAALLSGVVIDALEKGDKQEAVAIIDLLAPVPTSNAPVDLLGRVVTTCRERGRDLLKEPIILTGKGWRGCNEVRIPPRIDQSTGTDRFRNFWAFATPAEALEMRSAALTELINRLGGAAEPSTTEFACTVERAAKSLFDRRGIGADWPDFWIAVQKLLPVKIGQPHPLIGYRVLLGRDGSLHAAASGPEGLKIFFSPREREDTTDGATTITVPKVLGKQVAFMHEKVAGGQQEWRTLRRYFSQGDPELVHEYRVDEIFERILIPQTPAGKVAHGSRSAKRCRAILHLAVSLLRAARETSSLTPLLRDIRLPCRGGWYPAGETHFGDKWPCAVGDSLSRLLAEIDPHGALIQRLLLPPEHSEWPERAAELVDWLCNGGVVDGLAIQEAQDPTWSPTFSVSRWVAPCLPRVAPRGAPVDSWASYVEEASRAIAVRFTGSFQYRLNPVRLFPGFDRIGALSEAGWGALTRVLLVSIPNWPGSWGVTAIRKEGGQGDHQEIESFLHFVLRTLPWISDGGKERWHASDRWFVPSQLLAGGAHQFSHLDCLPKKLAADLEKNPRALLALTDLGLPRFLTEEMSPDPRLIETLARAVTERVVPGNRDVFVNHVRQAWRCFDPGDNGTFPASIVVRRGASLDAVDTGDGQPVLLPDKPQEHLDALSRAIPMVEIEAKEAKRLLPRFQRQFGKVLRPTSALSIRALIGEDPWPVGISASLLADSQLKWLPVFALTVAANYGEAAHGPHTKRIQEAMNRLRCAQVVLLESGPLRLETLCEGEPLSRRTVSAAWLSDERLLLIDRSSLEWIEGLAEPIAAVLDREDLTVPLKLALSRLVGREPSREDRIFALKVLSIDETCLGAIEQLWLGDLEWTRARIKPALRILLPEWDSFGLDDTQSLDQLRGLIETRGLTPSDASDLLQQARCSDSDESMGRWMNQRYAASAELDQWNHVMTTLGPPYRPMRNKNAEKEFKGHFESARLALHSIMRKLAIDAAKPDLYTTAANRLEALAPPEELAQTRWNVAFPHAMEVVTTQLRDLGVAEPILGLLARCTASTALTEELINLGYDASADPVQIHGDNRHKVLHALETIRKAALVSLSGRGLEPQAWQREPDDLGAESLKSLDDGVGFLLPLSDDEAFRKAAQHLSGPGCHDEVIRQALCLSLSAADLLGRLGLSVGDLTKHADYLEQLRQARERRQRTISVCGKEFYCDDSNLRNLARHVGGQIVDAAVTALDLGNLAPLVQVNPGRTHRTSTGSAGRRRVGRAPEWKRQLVGLIGEIHAFRVLKKTLGQSAVSAKSWVSENSRYRFPANVGDDTFGCDFHISNGGIEYFVEVKASEGEEQEFELGSSEARRAAAVANQQSSRFLILHVRNALSANPRFDLLPNPYDSSSNGLYGQIGSGVRLRYQRRP